MKSQGQWEKALDSYQHALTLKPDDPGVYNNMGLVYAHAKVSGKRHSTVANMPWHWSLTILMSTTDSMGFSICKSKVSGKRHSTVINMPWHWSLTILMSTTDSMGLVYAMTKVSGKRHSTVINTSLTLKPDNPDVYNSMGLLLWRGRSVGKRHSTVINMPWHWSLTILMSTTRWVSCIKSQGQWEKALDSYRHALILKPDNPDVYNNMGLVYGKQGQREKALDSCQHALTLKPDDPGVYTNMGLVYAHAKVSGKRHSTVANMPWHWQPDDPGVYNSMGLVYWNRPRSVGKGTRQLSTCLDTEAWRSWDLQQYGFSLWRSRSVGKGTRQLPACLDTEAWLCRSLQQYGWTL